MPGGTDFQVLEVMILSGRTINNVIMLTKNLDPIVMGIDGYRSVIYLRTFILGLSIPTVTTIYHFFGLPGSLLSLAILIVLYIGAPSVYRHIAASNLDRELTALLLYLLPFSWSARSVADVLISLSRWRREPFKWTSKEASRLETILGMGKDPLSALSYLAETTPSRKLRDVLEIIVDSSKSGISKESTIADLASIAIEQVRSSWKNYVELAQLAAEASVALVLSIAVIVPIASMSSIGLWALQLPILFSALFTFVLLIYQPTLGLNLSRPWLRFLPAVAVILATVLMVLKPLASLTFLALTTILFEVIWRRFSSNFKRSLESFRRATDKARLGLPVAEDLQASRPLLGNVIDAMTEAVKIAGTLGVWKVMEKIYRTVREAIRSASDARSTSYILMGVSAIAPAISIYIVKSIMSISGSGNIPAFNLNAVAPEAIKWVLLSTPLGIMPSATLHRPRFPSLIPSLIATVLALWIVLKLALLPL